MEKFMMIKNHTRMSPSTPSPLSIHKDSQTISKPKIRIIHIFAPEIIKTDVADFRELVQRLTGKPPHRQNGCCKKKPRYIARNGHGFSDKSVVSTKKMELRTRFLAGLETILRVKEEDEGMWGNIGENSSGGFLSGFGDLDGFLQELGDRFPLFPLDASHLMHGSQEA